MASFFSRLSYSFGNEDWKCDQKALKIKPDDHVLCITASGDRPLNLLVGDCQKITSVDANPIQNHLLHLKMAALNNLNYKEFLGFIGATPCKDRKKMLSSLMQGLEENAREYWEENKRKIAKGVLYQGAVERLCIFLSFIIKLLKGFKNVDTLMKFDDLQDQIQFIETVWNTPLWRKSFQLALHPALTKPTMKDPGLYANIGDNIKAGDYIYNRMQEALHRGLVKENPLIAMILDGKVPPEAYPPCLTSEGTKFIQQRLGRITAHTQDIVSFLEESKPDTFDCFSMSDVVSYLNPQDYLRMLKAILKTAKPGARFCLRQFLSGYTIPAELQEHFVRNYDLEKDVEKNDRCFVYRYMIGEVKK